MVILVENAITPPVGVHTLSITLDIQIVLPATQPPPGTIPGNALTVTIPPIGKISVSHMRDWINVKIVTQHLAVTGPGSV